MSDLTASQHRIATQSEFRVLVVDDDQDMAGFLAHMLRKEGMEADTAGDGRSALARVVALPPDLVMLDVLMPGLSGFDVCRQLKADPSTALIPIVLITALDDSESRVRGIEAGADDFLSKPVNREELLARVKTLRKLHETRRELEHRRLAAEVERKETIRKAFSRYISPGLAERIIQDLGTREGPFRVNAQRIEVVALFADLRGFTRITEHTEVGDVVEMLNEYFSILTEAAYQRDGTIFNMAGDSLLIGFNVPLPQKDAAARALQCAQEMVVRFAPVGRQWERRLGIATGVGIGICKGEAIIGNIGSPHYMSYTIIGNPVNTAARLMQMAAANEVLVCGPFYEAVRRLVPEQNVRSRGDVALRGRSEPTPVYCIAGSRSGV
ncbi:MAG: response regulator [Candidatus Binataceae bacterium]|nr:response regulator [Candidatus Binataceae bacterium]